MTDQALSQSTASPYSISLSMLDEIDGKLGRIASILRTVDNRLHGTNPEPEKVKTGPDGLEPNGFMEGLNNAIRRVNAMAVEVEQIADTLSNKTEY